MDVTEISDVFFSLKNFDNRQNSLHKIKNQDLIKFGKEIYKVTLNT